LVGITPESSTSVKLLNLLLEGRYGIHLKYHLGFEKEDDARLLIGDAALKALLDKEYELYYPCRIDLGEEWINWQKLPFVFARWMIRKDIDPQIKKKLQIFLDANANKAQVSIEKVLLKYEKERNFSIPWGKEYLSSFNYVLGKDERKAISVFKNMISRFPDKNITSFSSFL